MYRTGRINYSRKKINLDAWLGPGRAFSYLYITVLEIQTKICIQTKTIKDGIILINYFHLKFTSLANH